MTVKELVKLLSDQKEQEREVLFITGLSDTVRIKYKVLSVLNIPGQYLMIDMEGKG